MDSIRNKTSTMQDAPDEPLLDEDALLAVISGIWGPHDPLTGLESPVEGTQEAVEAEEPKKKRRRDRNRPIHEIARLQVETKQLELKLQDQLSRAGKRARGSLQSFVMNSELKTELQQSLEDVRALEQNLARQMQELVQATPLTLMANPRNLPFKDTQDAATFRAMAHIIDGQYNDMDRVLRLAGLHGVQSEVTDACICPSSGGDVLRSRAQILSPFKSQALVTAMWTSFEACEGSTMANKSIELEFLRGISSRVTVQKYELALGDHVCTMRMVVKQFVETNRVVHVWNVLGDWSGVGNVRNVKTCERGWGFIQPTNGDNAAGSVCMSYCLVSPTVDGVAPLSDKCDGIRSLIKLYHRFVISRLQGLENKTLDQCVREERSEANSSVDTHEE